MENFKDWSSLLPLRPSGIDNIPSDVIGIYGFWSKYNNRCIYIGKAKRQSIRKRIRQGYRHSHNSQLKAYIRRFRNFLELRYLTVPCDKIRDIDKLEKKFIDLWNPETNITGKKR